MSIDSKFIRQVLIRLGDEQEIGAIACIMVDATSADIQFMSKHTCPYRIQALRVLAVTLRELAAHVDEAISELEPEADGSSSN